MRRCLAAWRKAAFQFCGSTRMQFTAPPSSKSSDLGSPEFQRAGTKARTMRASGIPLTVSNAEQDGILQERRCHRRAACQSHATRFSDNRTACKNCGADPRSAAGPLAGLPVVDETDPVGEERVQGGNLLLWHLLERWLAQG